jgi:phosphoribosylformylglycinamidine (FGAM) synthase-like enzyme
MDGPSDAAVLKPLGTWHHERAFSLAVGINPQIGRVDPYAMAVSAIDEAFRNSVAVGADPDQLALLDNFCWGNPTYPDRLGALVRACQGCYDGAIAYHAPFISGKDSLYNEFNGNPIPGTLLISAIAIVPEMKRSTTSALKRAGNVVYLLGETRDELGGSLLHMLLGREGGAPPSMPDDPLTRYRSLHRAILDGRVAACHDLSEGGLAVAAAEMAIGGRLGLQLTLPPSLASARAIFSESNGRLLIEVAPEDAASFETHFAGQALARIGVVQDESRLLIETSGHTILDAPLAELVAAWKGTVQL